MEFIKSIAVAASGLRRVALLGTRFTMGESFYRDRLTARGIEVLVPDADGMAEVDRVIYEELCRGTVCDRSREAFVGIVKRLAGEGAQAVILGCTEITMLIGAADVPVPVFDTTAIHAETAVAFAIADERQAARPS